MTVKQPDLPLRLMARDAQDLETLSAHLQDAVGRVSDMTYLPGVRRFACIVNRFRWDRVARQPDSTVHERTRTGVHFEHVLSVRSRGIDPKNPEGILNLLSVSFEEEDAPSGTIMLTFSGDAEIRLEVEVLEVRLGDMGLSWSTGNLPTHEDQ